MPSRRLVLQAALGSLVAPAFAARRAPFRQLAVAEPPFEEVYEVLIAMAPPLARTTIGKLVTQGITEIDQRQKAEALTAALDPERTDLHQQFLLGLADGLADAGAQVLRVPVDEAEDERGLLDQLRERVPKADALLLANASGRFVALHGVDSYAPSVVVGVKLLPAGGGKPWIDGVFSAGFRSLDPTAVHLDGVALAERFADHAALLLRSDEARAALQRGAQAIGAEVARRLAG
jgi:hypothetical protein